MTRTVGEYFLHSRGWSHFVQEYMMSNQPALIRDFQDAWSYDNLSIDSLLGKFGTDVVRVSISPSGRFDGPEPGRLWGLSEDRDVLVRLVCIVYMYMLYIRYTCHLVLYTYSFIYASRRLNQAPSHFHAFLRLHEAPVYARKDAPKAGDLLYGVPGHTSVPGQGLHESHPFPRQEAASRTGSSGYECVDRRHAHRLTPALRRLREFSLPNFWTERGK